jgi:hypothetical protein
LTPFAEQIALTILGAGIAGSLTAFGAWVAMRVTVAKLEQKIADDKTSIDTRFADHREEIDRRFTRVERIVGINGDPPVFLTAAEWRVHASSTASALDTLDARFREVANGQREIRDLVISKMGGDQ